MSDEPGDEGEPPGLGERLSALPGFDRLSALPHQFVEAIKPRRWKKTLGWAARVAGVGAIFLTSAVGGVLLHLDTKAGRGVAQKGVNAGLASVFKGRIEVGEIEELQISHARIKTVRIYDPSGDEVIFAENVEADVQTIALLKALFTGEGPVSVAIPNAQIEHAVVHLLPDERGVPSIATTFLPRVESPPSRSLRATIVSLPSIDIRALDVDGHAGAAKIDSNLHDIHGDVFVRDDRIVAVDVDHAKVALRDPVPAELAGAVSYHLRVDIRPEVERRAELEPNDRLRSSLLMWTAFEGTFAGIPTSVAGTMEGTKLDAKATVPEIRPEALRAAFPQVPLLVPASAELRLAGDVPSALGLQGDIELRQGDRRSRVLVDGELSADETIRLLLDARVIEVDPRAFYAAAPEARIDARARVGLTLVPGEGAPRLAAELASEPTTVMGQLVPAVDAIVHLHEGQVLVTAKVHEVGLPLEAQVAVASDGAVTFSAWGESTDLMAAPRLGKNVRGAVQAQIQGSFAKGELFAKVTANGRGVGTAATSGSSAVSTDRTSVVAQIAGPIDKLRVEAQASASGLAAADDRLDTVRVGVVGSLLSPDVTIDVDDREHGRISAAGSVSILGKAARNVRFKIEKDGESAAGTIAAVEVGKGVTIKNLDIQEGSIGALGGSLDVDGGEIIGQLHARALDLERLQRLFALPIPMSGVANVDVEIARSPRGRKGSIELEIERGSLLLVEGISARVSARMDGDEIELAGFVRVVDDAKEEERRAKARAREPATPPPVKPEDAALASADGTSPKKEEEVLVCDGPIIELRLSNAKGRLDGPLLSPKTWQTATGSVDVAVDNADLGCIERRIPPFLRPFDKARGLVTARFTLARDPGDAHPSVRAVKLVTTGLELVGKKEAWKSEALDVAVVGGFDGKTGKTDVEAAAFGREDTTIVVQTKATMKLDAEAILAGGDALVTSLRRAPIDIEVAIPERTIASLNVLPAPVGGSIPTMDGSVSARVTAKGTLEAPTIDGKIVAKGLGSSASSKWVPTLQVDLGVVYDPVAAKGGANAVIRTSTGDSVATLASNVYVSSRALWDTPAGRPLPWHADAHLDLEELPLENVPALSDREVKGNISGTIDLRGINERPELTVALKTTGLEIHDLSLEADLSGSVGPTGAATLAVVVSGDPRKTDNDQAGAAWSLRAEAEGAMIWQDGAIPVPDMKKPGKVVVTADRFRIGTLYPLVAGTLSKLEGNLKGRIQASWGNLEDPMNGKLEILEQDKDTPGSPRSIELTELVAYVPQLGQELHGGRALVTMRVDAAKQIFDLTNFEAQGSSGRIHGALHASLSGLHFNRAWGRLDIDEGEELPITIEGVSFGKASGTFVLRNFAQNGGALEALVTVQNTSFSLPESSSRSVQDLGKARGVSVSQPLGPPEEKRSAEATPIVFVVTIQPTLVKSSQIEVKLKSVGQPGPDQDPNELPEAPLVLILSDRLHATGDISIFAGTVVVNKKTFKISDGLVRLRDEDTGNPYVNLTAFWDAATDLRVFVDYAGLLFPITDDKIRLRSDPPRSQEEIAQMLIFGQDAASAANLFGVVGGSFATSFANDVLSTLGGPFRDRFSLSVGTSDTESSAKVGIKVSDTVKVGVGYSESTSTNPAQKSGGCGDVNLEWQLSDHWSLRGTGGYCDYSDQNESESTTTDGITVGVDALWQTRY